LHGGPEGINRIDYAIVSYANQVSEKFGSYGAFFITGSDDGDSSWVEDFVEVFGGQPQRPPFFWGMALPRYVSIYNTYSLMYS